MVRVTWLDAWVDPDNVGAPHEVIEKLKECREYGVLVRKTRNTVIVAANDEPDANEVGYVTQIPMALVLKIEKVTALEPMYEKNGVSHEQKRPNTNV